MPSPIEGIVRRMLKRQQPQEAAPDPNLPKDQPAGDPGLPPQGDAASPPLEDPSLGLETPEAAAGRLGQAEPLPGTRPPSPPRTAARQAMKDEDEAIAGETFRTFSGGQSSDDLLKEKYGIDPDRAPPAPDFPDRDKTIFNMNRMNAPDDIKTFVFETTDRFKAEFDAYRRGRQKLSDIERRAETMALFNTTEDILKLKGITGEELNMAGFAMMRVAGEIKEIAGKGVENLSDVDLARVRLLQEDFVAIAMHTKKLETETARALSALRNQKRVVAGATEELASVVQGFGGRAYNKELMNMIDAIEDPLELVAFLHKTQKVRRRDMLWEIYYNVGLLSNPQTWAVNGITSLAAHYYKGLEYAGAFAVGKMRRAITGGEEGIYFRELMAYASNQREYLRAAMNAWTAFRTARPVSGGSKFEGDIIRDQITMDNLGQLPEIQMLGAIVPQFMKGEKSTRAAKAVGDFLFDYTIRLSKRAMLGADEFVKTLQYGGRKRMLIERQIIEEGLSGQAAKDRLNLLMNHTDEIAPHIDAEARAAANEVTFQTELGGLGQKIQEAVMSRPDTGNRIANALVEIGMLPIRLTFPFMKTPINVVKFAARRGPIGMLMPDFVKKMAAGGPAADMAMARLMIGNSIVFGLWEMGLGGYITGAGPTDRNARKAWEDLGFQEYSFIVPKDSALGRSMGLTQDRSISYKRGDPFSMMMGVVADYKDVAAYATDEEQSEIVAALAAAAYRNLMSRTYLEGAERMFKAQSGLETGNTRLFQQWISGMLVSPAAPAGVAWYTRTFEDNKRKVTRSDESATLGFNKMGRAETDKAVLDVYALVHDMIDKIRARMPGWGEGLPNYRNYWGKELEFNPGMLGNVVPFFQKDLEFDVKAVKNLGLPEPQRWGGMPSRTMDYGTTWQSWIDTVGPSGEFVRLGWAPDHPQKVEGISLKPWEKDTYVREITSIRGGADDILTAVDPRNDDKVEVLFLEDLTLRDAMTELMKTEFYHQAPDNNDMTGSKKSLIIKLQNMYRSRLNRDEELRLGGAQLRLFLLEPEFADRYRQTIQLLGTELQQEQADDRNELLQSR